VGARCETLRSAGLNAEARACHIGRIDDIAAIAEHLQNAHGGLDILVNNAVLSPWRAIEDIDPSLFAKTVDVNLRGYWFMSSEAAKLMKPRGGLVNISSVSALHPEKMLGLHGTLKTALIGMSRAFALEYGPYGVRANTVLPGVIDTSLAGVFDGEVRDRILHKTPLQRIGRPEEIGYAVLYLSLPAGAFVTGASVVVDGGLSISTL
jgi:NAD(P)-dependent dehydrogenase (short-subunit alcohol dehydrogenase family)